MTLEIPVELENDIRAAAAARGTSASAFVIDAARRALDPDVALDALLDALTDRRALAGLGPLPDEALSRAAFYSDGEADGEADGQGDEEAV